MSDPIAKAVTETVNRSTNRMQMRRATWTGTGNVVNVNGGTVTLDNWIVAPSVAGDPVLVLTGNGSNIGIAKGGDSGAYVLKSGDTMTGILYATDSIVIGPATAWQPIKWSDAASTIRSAIVCDTGVSPYALSLRGGSDSLSTAGYINIARDLILSPDIYRPTTTAAANVNVVSSGLLTRSTSSLWYKHDIIGLDGITFPEVVPYDRRMKPSGVRRQRGSVRDVVPVAEKVLDLTPVQFVADRVGDGNLRNRVGLIAEDVEAHTPWALSDSKDAIEWSSITAALLQVVKDQQATITALEARVAALEGAT